MPNILRTQALSQFVCLGDKCEDTCCQAWSMQVDDDTLARYRSEAPELLDVVEKAPEAGWIMRKDPHSGLCVKLEGGLCGIHKQYGDRFLGDACHFYPRVTRALGEQAIMTGALSCPEMARLALLQNDSCAMNEVSIERLPHTLKNYLPEDIVHTDAITVHRAFLAAVEDEEASAELIFLRLASVSRSLERIDKKSWVQASPFYFKHVDARLPLGETQATDPFNLLHALCGLIVASQKPPSLRLRQTIEEMEKALTVTLDWEHVQITATEASLASYHHIHALWSKEAASLYNPLLRRWLQMQLSLALFPYAGFGHTLSERITIIGVRLATLKLALMSSYEVHQEILSEDHIIRIVQSLSRFMDHLGDPAFSWQIYTETGWIRESRMRGLLEI